MSQPASHSARPPLWLASAATVAGWGAIYDIGVWVVQFARQPVHPDFRIFYVAAEAGLRFGWASIYDVATLRSLSKSLPPGQDYISSALPFIHPPLLAWLIAPLTSLPLGVAYAVWCALLLAALVWVWYIAAPYSGLRKVALLLLALAIWPVLDAFYFGQPSTLQLALLAAAWWLCLRERPLAAGAALALATALKPHTVILVPLALAASGRYRPFFSWAAVTSLLAAWFALVLGPAGLNNWWQALVYGQSDPGQSLYTLAYIFGSGPVSYALEAVQGAAALVIARRRRADRECGFRCGHRRIARVRLPSAPVRLHRADPCRVVGPTLGAAAVAPHLFACRRSCPDGARPRAAHPAARLGLRLACDPVDGRLREANRAVFHQVPARVVSHLPNAAVEVR